MAAIFNAVVSMEFEALDNNTEYAGLEIPVFLCITSSFSRQIANHNAGPSSALESMGAIRPFCHIFFKYCSNVQTISEKKVDFSPYFPIMALIFSTSKSIFNEISLWGIIAHLEIDKCPRSYINYRFGSAMKHFM